MRVTRIQANNFLSYGELDLELATGVTTITGPNSVGKSNLGRCVELVVKAVGRFAHAVDHEQLGDFEQSGRDGAGAFRVGLGLVLNQPWERELIANCVRSILAYGTLPQGSPLRPNRIDHLMREYLVSASFEPLFTGTLWVIYDKASRTLWSGAWEFAHNERLWHVALFGANLGQLRPGPAHADASLVPGNIPTLLEALLAATPINARNLGEPSQTDPDYPPADTADKPSAAPTEITPETQPMAASHHPEAGPAQAGPGTTATTAENQPPAQPSQPGPLAQPGVPPLDQAGPKLSFDFTTALPADGNAVSFSIYVTQDGSSPLAQSLQQLGTAMAIPDVERTTIDLTQVIWAVLDRGVVLTENRRMRFARRFPANSLHEPVAVADGVNVPALLYVLKNGDGAQRRRFARVQGLFHQLTDDLVDLRCEPADNDTEGEPVIAIDPVIVHDRADRRVNDSGAGRQEALLLACLLAGPPGRFLVLDEPAANIEVVGQRRLIGALRGAGQCLLITHSPDLVPVVAAGDLANLVRLAPGPDGTRVFRAPLLSPDDESKWVNRFEDADTRALLFTRSVVLVEGGTERGALTRWWAQLDDPPLASTGLHLVDVGSEAAFGLYVEFLATFGVQWAVVADGPALAPGSNMDKQLRKQGLAPDGAPDNKDDFAAWSTYWRTAGIYTLARVFGNDGTKAGEIEAFLQRVDPSLYATAERLLSKSKPRVGAYFAAHCPPPPEVRQLYRDLIDHFGLHHPDPMDAARSQHHSQAWQAIQINL